MEIDPKKMDFDKMKSDENLEGDANANQAGNVDGIGSGAKHNPAPSFVPPAASAPASNSSQPTASLKKPTELLSEAWQLYKARWKTFLGIMVAPILLMLLAFLVFGVGVLGVGFLESFISKSSIVNIVIYLVGFVLILALFLAVIIIQFWSQVALIYAIKDSEENIGIKESYKRGWRKIKPFIWVSILSSFIIIGGYIFFVIPGIIFTVWFIFAVYIVVAEDLKGMNAILKSREYVRNYWWQVLWRLLFLFIVITITLVVILLIGIIVGSILSFFIGEAITQGIFNLMGDFVSVIIAPLSMIYSFLIYNNLRKIKGDFEFKPSAKTKKSFIAVGVLGILAIPLLFILIVLVSLNSAKDKAADTARFADISQIQINLMIYYDEEGEYPESLSELDINYKDPKTKEPYEYYQLDNGKDYKICASFKKGRRCFSSEDSVSDLYRDKSNLNDADEKDANKKKTFEDNIKGRDKQRISDLNSISRMLRRYKAENGIYPVSRVPVKLNENNQITNKIKFANENANVPVDPKDPEYYYIYQSSNGESFELSARLENLDDPSCNFEIKARSNVCIYKLRY